MDDKKEIRKLIELWMKASKEGDIDTVLDLMSDDVIFMTVNNEPFGKEAFRKSSENMKDIKIDGKADIKEIEIIGDIAFSRVHLKMSMETPEKTINRQGYTLTIFRRENGKWRLFRDANLLR